jgi:hypothetical protein
MACRAAAAAAEILGGCGADPVAAPDPVHDARVYWRGRLHLLAPAGAGIDQPPPPTPSNSTESGAGLWEVDSGGREVVESWEAAARLPIVGRVIMFKVQMYDKRNSETGVAEIVGIETLEEANRRAELEAYYCCETLLGEWQVAAESMVGGKYAARLAPSTGEAGEITIYVKEVHA